MNVELEMHIDENDESIIMEKVSELTKHAKELRFTIDEIEIKNSDRNKHGGAFKMQKEDKKRQRRSH